MTADQTPPITIKDDSECRAADAIIREIEQQIVSGKLPDQTPLPSERSLMVQFSTSRTVVREAITALSNRGLIENRPRFRPVVKKPGFDTAIVAMSGIVKHLLGQQSGVKNLFDSRVFIERQLVRDAATRARKPDIDNLTAALRDNKDAISSGNDFYLTDSAFHGVLYQIPGNPVFPAVQHEAYTGWLAPPWIEMPRSPERNLLNYRSHEAIYNAIVARDPETAEAALLRHLTTVWEYVSQNSGSRDSGVS